MRLLLVIGGCAALIGCTEQSVYERELPAPDDRAAMVEIRDGLAPADAQAWQRIVMRRMNPAARPIESRTVGEAITRIQAQAACMDEHSTAQRSLGVRDVEAYNQHVAAYNACLEMPV